MSADIGSAASTWADQLRSRNADFESLGNAEIESEIRDVVQTILPTGTNLPKFNTLNLYLVRGLNTVSINGAKSVVVAFPPEFLYVIDVGYPALIGVSVPWMRPPIGFGEPDFPNFAKATIRSVPARTASALIFPDVVGELIVGVDSAESAAAVTRGLEREGLWDVSVAGTFATARCVPFRERPICKDLPGRLPFVRYAEPNHVMRRVDISPGWRVMRLA